MRLLYSSWANPRRTIGEKKINLDTTCCNDRLSWLLIRNSGRNRHEPTQPTAVRNAHQVLGRSFKTLIGGELGIPHFISHWVVTHGPITLWARGWPAELWRRTLNERGPVTDRPNSWNFRFVFCICVVYVWSTEYSVLSFLVFSYIPTTHPCPFLLPSSPRKRVHPQIWVYYTFYTFCLSYFMLVY